MATNNVGNFSVTVDNSKYMTFPNQPGFSVYNSSDYIDATGTGALYTPAQFNTTLIDRGSNFAGNIFTAPISGIYLLSANIYAIGDFNSTTLSQISIITTSLTFIRSLSAEWSQDPYYNPAMLSFQCSTICYLAIGDTAQVGWQITGPKYINYYKGEANHQTNFSGVLLC